VKKVSSESVVALWKVATPLDKSIV